jgi:hypothetical protein
VDEDIYEGYYIPKGSRSLIGPRASFTLFPAFRSDSNSEYLVRPHYTVRPAHPLTRRPYLLQGDLPRSDQIPRPRKVQTRALSTREERLRRRSLFFIRVRSTLLVRGSRFSISPLRGADPAKCVASEGTSRMRPFGSRSSPCSPCFALTHCLRGIRAWTAPM